MDTVRSATREHRADADVRKRPVVLAAGTLDPGTHGRSRAARAVFNVTIAVLLTAGAVAAGGWSIMTAARGSTPSSERSPLWYPTPLRLDANDGRRTAQPRPATTPSTAGAAPLTPRPTGDDRGSTRERGNPGTTGGSRTGRAGRGVRVGGNGQQRSASPGSSTKGGADSGGHNRGKGDDGGRSGRTDRSGKSGTDDRDEQDD